MSKIYMGELLLTEDGKRELNAKSMVKDPSTQDTQIDSIFYEKVGLNFGRELFTKKVFPLFAKVGPTYWNNSFIDAAAGIVEDPEWGLVDDVDYLQKCLYDFMNDPNFEESVQKIKNCAELNQSISEGIRQQAIYYGALAKENLMVHFMGNKAKQIIKSNRK